MPEQPSPGVVFPSSHVSPGSTIPSPQMAPASTPHVEPSQPLAVLVPVSAVVLSPAPTDESSPSPMISTLFPESFADTGGSCCASFVVGPPSTKTLELLPQPTNIATAPSAAANCHRVVR